MLPYGSADQMSYKWVRAHVFPVVYLVMYEGGKGVGEGGAPVRGAMKRTSHPREEDAIDRGAFSRTRGFRGPSCAAVVQSDQGSATMTIIINYRLWQYYHHLQYGCYYPQPSPPPGTSALRAAGDDR
jgi:hypothetical protein